MLPKHLSVVPPTGDGSGLPAEVYDLGAGPETVSDRVKRLQQEAKLLAQEEVENLEKAMMAVSLQAKQIAEGGDAYAPGVRDLAGRIASDVDQRALMLQAMLERTSHL
jgi:hypothetical protein